MLGNSHDIACRLFSKLTFQRIISGILSECQTVWIQIKTDVMSVLNWVQTVCPGNQQTTLVGTEYCIVWKRTRDTVILYLGECAENNRI